MTIKDSIDDQEEDDDDAKRITDKHKWEKREMSLMSGMITHFSCFFFSYPFLLPSLFDTT